MLVGFVMVVSVVVAACLQGLVPRWYHSFRLSLDAGYLEQLLAAESGTPADDALEAWLRSPAGRLAATELFVDLLVHDFEPHWKPQSRSLERVRIGVIGAGDLGSWRDEGEITFDRHLYGFRWDDERETRLGNIPMSPLAVVLAGRLGSLRGPPIAIERYPGFEFEVVALEDARKRYSTYPPDPNALIVFDTWVRPHILVVQREGSRERWERPH